MKTISIQKTKTLLLCLLLFLQLAALAQKQGRVVINEYLPWPNQGCPVTSEFVELMNFGPGPVDISCYILTDGDFAVTIPKGTILQPGQFYVISGQNTIAKGCANIEKQITVDLNWTTCGCTSGPIPTTGEGWFTDNGEAEQMVLLDPTLKIIDAVIRTLPAETSSTITTSGVGGCAPKTFNLNNMNVKYEAPGMSTGRGNSFARKVDGDCGWLKDPQQSAGASNNTPGDFSDISYDLTVTNSMDCNQTRGSIEVFVKHNNYASIFPMNYTMAYDENKNGIFDFDDTYTYGEDNSPPTIDISGLGVGRYRLTVGSVAGCYLQTFDFTILPCYALLPIKLIDFKAGASTPQTHTFHWQLADVEHMKNVVLEKRTATTPFVPATTIANEGHAGYKKYSATVPAEAAFTFYRLKIVGKDGTYFYSPVINLGDVTDYSAYKIGPNPVRNEIHLQLTAAAKQVTTYKIYSLQTVVGSGRIALQQGPNSILLPADNLPSGIYQLVVSPVLPGGQPISIRFVVQK